MTAPAAPADPLAVEAQVCLAMSAASRALVAFYRPLLEPLGLTHPQYLAMLALWQYEPLSVKELGELLQLDPGTLSPLLKRLQALGYINRERDSKDERALRVTLTPEGRALRGEAEKIPPAIVARLGMSLEELQDLHRVLTRVIAAARGDGGDPAPAAV